MVNRKDTRIHGSWAGEISEVRPWLFLSGARAVRPKKLKDLNVTCVVNATVELPEVVVEGVEVLSVRISDSPSTLLHPHLHVAADKIDLIRSAGGRVLVHCVAGVSRSASLVLAYLVKYESLSLREAFAQVKSIRPVIRPNSNFFKHLIAFEIENRGVSTVSLINIPGTQLIIPDVCEDELKMMSSKSWTQVISERRNLQNRFA